MGDLKGIFVASTYLAMICKVNLVVVYISKPICKTIWSVCPYSKMPAWLIFSMWQLWHMQYVGSDTEIEILYTCMHTYMSTYKHTYIHLCMSACIQTDTSTFIHHICMDAPIHRCMNIYIHACINTYVQTHGCVSIYMYMYTCKY